MKCVFLFRYNGHPDFRGQFDHIDFSKIRDVVIIGQGNVSIDCARVLIKSISELKSTDISSEALQKLEESSIQNVA